MLPAEELIIKPTSSIAPYIPIVLPSNFLGTLAVSKDKARGVMKDVDTPMVKVTKSICGILCS